MKSTLLLTLLLSGTMAWADDLNVTISGSANEKAPLETLSPKPPLPNASEMTFSLDGGKSAVGDEIVPLTVEQAVLGSDLSKFQIPVLPTIPQSPFVVQPIPSADDPALSHFRPFGRHRPSAPLITSWDFFVVDDTNKELYRTSGDGLPSASLIWNGQGPEGFALKPDQTYFPFLVLKSSSPEITVRIPGEAERYLAFETRKEEDEIITFGDRLYEKEKAAFSPLAQIYLKDLKYRLTQMDPRAPFRVFIVSTKSGEALSEPRKKTWQTFLETTLQRKINSEWIVLSVNDEDGPFTQIRLPHFADPTRPKMTGVARDPRPGSEDMKTWIQIKESEKVWTVEMRHDRLFRTGSAYLRDESLPLLVDSLKKVREINLGKSKKEKKPILLRSYMQKPREYNSHRTFEEDPKLAALRSKVLFMLFAEETYRPQ